MSKQQHTKKKIAKKTLDELAKGANKVIGDHIQGGWLEALPNQQKKTK